MARMIAELGKPADIMASADYKVIDKALIPAMADWKFESTQRYGAAALHPLPGNLPIHSGCPARQPAKAG